MDTDMMMAGIDAAGKRAHEAIAKFLVEDGQCKTMEEGIKRSEEMGEELYQIWKKENKKC